MCDVINLWAYLSVQVQIQISFERSLSGFHTIHM